MAWEAPGQIVSFPCATTGLVRYRFVNISTAGRVIRTVLGGPSIGVIQDGTTGSTVDPTVASVMISGVSKIAVAASSTVGVGQIISASSHGSPVPSTVGTFVAGQIIAGSSAGANRVLSVLIAGVGNSTALV